MPTLRQQSAAQIVEHYSLLRPKLTPDERPLFDKAVELLEALSDIEGSTRLLALDAALIVGLFAVKATPATLVQMLASLTKTTLTLHAMEAIQHGRRDSN